jgi:hypothetical protein
MKERHLGFVFLCSFCEYALSTKFSYFLIGKALYELEMIFVIGCVEARASLD